MKWLQFITDLIGVILRFFGMRKKEQDEENIKILKDAEVRREEIDEKVENADDNELVDIAVDSGLVQRPNGASGSERS